MRTITERGDAAEYTEQAAHIGRAIGPEHAQEPLRVQSDGALKLKVTTRAGKVFHVDLQEAWTFCQSEPEACTRGTHRYLGQAFDRIAKSLGHSPE